VLDPDLDGGGGVARVPIVPALAVPRIAPHGALLVAPGALVNELLAALVAVEQQGPGALVDVAYVGAGGVLEVTRVVPPARRSRKRRFQMSR